MRHTEVELLAFIMQSISDNPQQQQRGLVWFQSNSTLTKLYLFNRTANIARKTHLKSTHCRREAQHTHPHWTCSLDHTDQSTTEYRDSVSLTHTYYFRCLQNQLPLAYWLFLCSCNQNTQENHLKEERSVWFLISESSVYGQFLVVLFFAFVLSYALGKNIMIVETWQGHSSPNWRQETKLCWAGPCFLIAERTL